MIDWKKCNHQFGPHKDIREPDFGVAFGSKRVCVKCGAVEYENWCETRANGGTPKIYPPEKKDES